MSMQKLKEMSDEELSERILENQSQNSGKKSLKRSELFQQKSPSKWKIMFEYVFEVIAFIIFPINLIRLIKEIKQYRKYATLIKYTIDHNESFYSFLEKYRFYPAWFTRLFSVQPIPEELVGLSDEQLYEMTVKSMLPVRSMVEQTNLLQVIELYIVRNRIDEYTIILQPCNTLNCKSLINKVVLSICLWIACIAILLQIL